MRRACFIGRYQPFHKGHEWLIDQKLKGGIPVLILVRATQVSEFNPFSSPEVLGMILERYPDNEQVQAMIIPDIESVNYGRGVGYEINEFEPPKDIGNISATEVRKCLKTGDDSWRTKVDKKLWNKVEEVLLK